MPIEDEADSLYIEIGRSKPAEKTEENPLDKGKSSSRAQYSPFSGDIDLVIDRSQRATQPPHLKGTVLEAV